MITTCGYAERMKHLFLFLLVILSLDVSAKTIIHSEKARSELLGKHSSQLNLLQTEKGLVEIKDINGTLHVKGTADGLFGWNRIKGIITEVFEDGFIFKGQFYIFDSYNNGRTLGYRFTGKNHCVADGVFVFKETGAPKPEHRNWVSPVDDYDTCKKPDGRTKEIPTYDYTNITIYRGPPHPKEDRDYLRDDVPPPWSIDAPKPEDVITPPF